VNRLSNPGTVCLAAVVPRETALARRFDAIVRNASLIDGTGARPIPADLAIDGDHIAAVGSVEGSAALEIEAAGLAVAPGFIDVHTHDDFAAVLYPDMGFKLLGGVTTCVVGNCGMGAAPQRPASALARAFHPGRDLPAWEGYGGYLDRLEREPASVNVAALVGHGTLRLDAMAADAREPSATELERMKRGLREGLEAGAVGLSTGLVYEPGRHATTDEIVELAAEMRGSGALYATHLRNEGERLLESIEEALEIGERAGVPVQISHHKAAGRENWGRVSDSLALIERAQARGLDVHADQYPYTAGSTILAAVVQSGGFRTRDASSQGGLGRVDPSDVVIASTARHPEWEGRAVADFAREWCLPGQEAAERVLAEEPLATIVIHSMCEEDVRRVLRHPSTMIGSDGIPSLEGKPHPRLYGTFARVLGHYARDEGLLPLEEAVFRMTGFPARKFGLPGRGVLREGNVADLVLFDPATIVDAGSYEDPHRPPRGIRHVFVNGRHAVRDGKHTGARAGVPLRRARN
jgi:N-acyl-D-amino-acid deacylase